MDTAFHTRLSEADVDDVTWLALGKTLLEQTIPTLNDHAKGLRTIIGWFSTICSATTLVAKIVKDTSVEALSPLLIALVFTILIAFLLVGAAQSPILTEVDLRSIDDIKTAISTTVTITVWRIRACLAFLALSALFIAWGLAVQVS